MICVFCQMGQGAEKKEFRVAVVGSVLGINEPYAHVLQGRLSPRVRLSALFEDFILHSQHTRDPSPGGLLGGIPTDWCIEPTWQRSMRSCLIRCHVICTSSEKTSYSAIPSPSPPVPSISPLVSPRDRERWMFDNQVVSHGFQRAGTNTELCRGPPFSMTNTYLWYSDFNISIWA